MSCPRHLESVYVSHGQGGAYELRCDSCYSSAETWKFLWPIIMFGIAIVAFLIFYFAVYRPSQEKWDKHQFPDGGRSAEPIYGQKSERPDVEC